MNFLAEVLSLRRNFYSAEFRVECNAQAALHNFDKRALNSVPDKDPFGPIRMEMTIYDRHI
jgi:hypothetical protein